MRELFEMLLGATNVRRVTDVIETFAMNHRISWRAVGDRENNLATINLGTDPAAGLIERITNAIDAVLERVWNEMGRPTNIRSPREAFESWFGIQDGRLENVADTGQNWQRQLFLRRYL